MGQRARNYSPSVYFRLEMQFLRVCIRSVITTIDDVNLVLFGTIHLSGLCAFRVGALHFSNDFWMTKRQGPSVRGMDGVQQG